ncbi:MAG: hypothetical protein LUC34_02135 [Campylobacter sp.]|nr:hypothetical protein [Campylobacter sp.]
MQDNIKIQDNKLESIYEKLGKLDTIRQKEEFLFDVLREAEKREDYGFVAQICDFALNEDYEKFGTNLRSSALMWLTSYIVSNIQDKNKRDKTEFASFYDLQDAMWKFKWIVVELGDSSAISKDRINEINQAMFDYYEWLDFSMAAYYKALMTQNIAMGDVREAKQNYKLWQELDKDEMNDCEACEVSERITYLTFIGEYEKALELSEPILSGELKCMEVPHITYAPIMFSMINLGRLEEAKNLLPKAIKLIGANNRTIDQMALIIEMAVRLGDYETALNLARKHSKDILDTNDDITILRFFIAVSAFDNKDYQTALEIARDFDVRNGNSYYNDYLNQFYSEYKDH